MGCNGTSNKSLVPNDSMLNGASKKISDLEKQAALIRPTLQGFRDDLLGFTNVSPSNVVDSALSDFTANSICAGYDDMSGLEKLEAQCLSDALNGLRSYLDDLLQNLEDGMDLISSLLSLPEFNLMKIFQTLSRLMSRFGGLFSSLDVKITCIANNNPSSHVQSELQSIQDRSDAIFDEFPIDENGQFSSDKLLEGCDPDLKVNMKSFETRSNTLKKEIEANIAKKLNDIGNLNPKRYF